MLQDVYDEISAAAPKACFLFAAAVEKSKDLWGEQAVAKATEEVCKRFDILLQRKFHEERDPQRGLLVFSEGRFDARAKLWVRGFRKRGTSWGAITNLADIPYFAAMKESRLLQAAEIVSHAVWVFHVRAPRSDPHSQSSPWLRSKGWRTSRPGSYPRRSCQVM